MALQRNPKERTAHELGLPRVTHTHDGQFWVTLPLGDWEASVRFEPEDGHPVVAEVRILPWVHWRDDGPPVTPPGGLTTRELRKLNLGPAVRFAYEWLDELFKDDTDPRSIMSPHRFSAPAVAAPRRPGRKGHGDRFYASIAAAYVHELKKGSTKPVKDLAEALSKKSGAPYSDTYVRDLLAEARRRELLTRPPKGVAGGELTKKGVDLLKGDES